MFYVWLPYGVIINERMNEIENKFKLLDGFHYVVRRYSFTARAVNVGAFYRIMPLILILHAHLTFDQISLARSTNHVLVK